MHEFTYKSNKWRTDFFYLLILRESLKENRVRYFGSKNQKGDRDRLLSNKITRLIFLIIDVKSSTLLSTVCVVGKRGHLKTIHYRTLIRVPKQPSGQRTRLSPMRPEFGLRDRQLVYVKGNGGRPHGHVCFLRALRLTHTLI